MKKLDIAPLFTDADNDSDVDWLKNLKKMQ